MLAPVCLLFMFNGCFLTGFYNYCLSTVLLWIILGLALRKHDRIGVMESGMLFVLFSATYFTHLIGYIAAVGATVCIVAGTDRHICGWSGCVGLATLPTGCLAVSHAFRSGIAESASHWSIGDCIGRTFSASSLGLVAIRRHGLGSVAPLIILYEVFALAALFCAKRKDEGADASRNRRRVWFLAVAFAVLYFVAPDFVGDAGGYLKVRFLLLPPLIILGAWNVAVRDTWRWGLLAAVYTVVSVNLFSTALYFSRGNQDIEEFLAGAGAVGRNRTLVALGHSNRQPPNPLEHAEGYYCLGTGNVAVWNYQAATPNFPIRYRPGISPGHDGSPEERGARLPVDVVLLWEDVIPPIELDRSYREVFRRGRLRVFRRNTIVVHGKVND